MGHQSLRARDHHMMEMDSSSPSWAGVCESVLCVNWGPHHSFIPPFVRHFAVIIHDDDASHHDDDDDQESLARFFFVFANRCLHIFFVGEQEFVSGIVKREFPQICPCICVSQWQRWDPPE